MDNCNTARKLGEQLVEKIEEAAAECDRAPVLVNDVEMKTEVEPCQHHQRNICLDGISDEMSKYLKNMLAANNVVLEGSLHVHMDIPSLNHAAHKHFSLTCNYPKGKGDQFKSRMEKNHPGAPLVHVVNGKGSRQDICIDAAPCFHMNHPYWAEFLDELIFYGDADNKLERSLWVALTSAECIAATRGMSIVKFAISDQLRYLAGKTNELASYGWSARHMSKQYDMLEAALVDLIDNPSLFTNKQHIMGIFKESKAMLPPFGEFLKHKCEEKMQRCVRNGVVVPKICLHELIIN